MNAVATLGLSNADGIDDGIDGGARASALPTAVARALSALLDEPPASSFEVQSKVWLGRWRFEVRGPEFFNIIKLLLKISSKQNRTANGPSEGRGPTTHGTTSRLAPASGRRPRSSPCPTIDGARALSHDARYFARSVIRDSCWAAGAGAQGQGCGEWGRGRSYALCFVATFPLLSLCFSSVSILK